MKKLTKTQFLSISVMLFGMFFGAGNLIFPPQLGKMAGSGSLIPFLTFSLTGIIFPMLAVVAVSKSKGLENLTSRVNKKFAIIFTILIFLTIGPGLAIPRNATVPFEMTIVNILPENIDISIGRAIFTFVFFVLSLYYALNSSKLVDSLGKILTPALLLIIVLLFVGIVTKNEGAIDLPKGNYANSPISSGFIDGYYTLDAIAGLNFGLLVYLMIKKFNVSDDDAVKFTVKAGIVSATIFYVIYAMLTFMGVLTSGLNVELSNGAQIISYLSQYTFGNLGAYLVIATFTLACLTTSIGLIVTVSDYFSTLTPKISTSTWKIIVTIISFGLSNFGLNTILEFSVPILLILYPFSLVVTILGLLHEKLKIKSITYKLSAISTFIISITDVLYSSFKVKIPLLHDLTQSLPFAEQGLNWVIPTTILIVLFQYFYKEK